MNYVKRDFDLRKSVALDRPRATRQTSPNWTISYRAIAPIAMVCDALMIFSMSILSGVAYHELIGLPGHLAQFSGFAAVVTVLFILLGQSQGIYQLPQLLNLKSQIRQVLAIWIAVFLFLTAIAFIMKVGEAFSRGATLSFAISGAVILIVARSLWRIFLADGLAVRRFASRRIALISEQDSASENKSDLLEALARHGLQLAHHFVLPSDHTDIPGRRQVIAHAISSLRGSNVEEIVVSANPNHWPELSGLLSQLRILPLPVNLVPVGPMSELFKLSSHTIGETITIELQSGPRTVLQRSAKRIADVVIAATALTMLLPLLLITVIAIALDSSGPIIFRQRRRGFNGRPFRILKFRTMSVTDDGDTVVQAQRNDARVTRIGNLLRRTSIDELPQLLNVLAGSMSIVGPRPHALAHDNQFDKLVGNYAYRHHVKPGLTGWAQVNGYRGETRTIEDIEQRIKCDLWYIDNWNLMVDFKIILMTLIQVIRDENAY